MISDLYPNDTVILQDNAPCHNAKETMAWLEGEEMLLMNWLASSPDLNPIENVWGLLKERLNRRGERPVTEATMIKAIQEEWDRLTDEKILNIIHSMPARVHAVVDAEGGHTRWYLNCFCMDLFCYIDPPFHLYTSAVPIEPFS